MVLSDNIAVNLENISRGYGNDIVLNELNLTIIKGTLNSLIGSSGSGKTTILKTILGKLKPEHGKVSIFGKKPWEKYSNIPGSDIGYSPQEVSLYTEITIEENLSFFGTIHNMPKQLFIQRRDYLKELLELPKLSKTVNQLSGGQRRRVSLAVALLHSPKLLILDEPTVGVCPLVTSNIWKHLNELVKKDGVTILITTHYLQECRQSDNILLLRNGKILEKGAPDHLLLRYDCKILEDVYLKLCRSDEEISVIEAKSNPSQKIQQNQNEVNFEQTIPLDNISTSGAMHDILITSNIQPLDVGNYNERNSLPIKYYRWYQTKTIFRHSISIAKRKLTQLYRYKSFLLFEIFVPTILTVLFFLSIGNVPQDLKFGIINQDSGDLGNQFLRNLMDPGTIFQLKTYDNINQTIVDIESGNLWGSIFIPTNFSKGTINRLFDPIGEMTPNSEMNVYMDLTNFQVNLLFDSQIQESFEKLANDSGITMKPIIQHAIYGDPKAKFNWFLSPAIIGIILYVHAMSFLAINFVRENYDGTRDRLICYGVSPKSFFFGHIIGHFPIIFFQLSVLLLIAVYAFDVPIKGSFLLVYLFIYLLNIIAMGQGILIGNFSRSESEAIQLGLGFFFCSFFLSGIIWPVEAIIQFGFISNLIPSTWSSLALRSIMIKNLPFSHPHIWKPFIILISWIIFLFILVDLSMPIRESNFIFKRIITVFKKKKNLKQQQQ